MENIDNKYVDENGNSWDANIYSRKEAEALSKTLTACISCTNCINCRDCTNCEYCTNCTVCTDCTNCTNCTDCRNCIDCGYCIDCRSCTNCRYCTDCKYCISCRNCRSCRDWLSNPSQYITPSIGSRNSQTRFYWNDNRTEVVCGCFSGSLEEFESKVKGTYPEKTNKHRKEYDKAIKFMKILTDSEV